MENKRDVSVSMERANMLILFTSIPVVIVQFAIFRLIHGSERMEVTWNFVIFILTLLMGVVVHELIHGLKWTTFGRKPFSAVQFGFQWKTFTPYAHLKEPIEVNAYRLGAFMQGFILGILTYLLSLVLGNGDLFWFSLIHTAAAEGDWLIMWLIRGVKAGRLVISARLTIERIRNEAGTIAVQNMANVLAQAPA